ncbi:MAG TPA: AI-2E family transporter, partial [Polymorphobacter sp.]|nr:AI-2E family transporter [Polymorphobacter sp.]
RMADTVLRLVAIAALLLASFAITRPFIGLLAWSVILAVILYPLHKLLRTRTGLGNSATATILGAVLTALLLVPLLIVIASIANSLINVLHDLKAGTLALPPAPPRLASLPVVGGKLAAAWSLMETNLPAAIERYRPFLTDVVNWLGGFVGGLSTAVLTFIAALVIASIIIAYGTPAAAFARDVLARLFGSRDRGDRFAALSVSTIRGVTNGVIGVAFVQALLMGIGFFVIGTPGAGLLALAVMLLGIVQVPAIIVGLPVMIFAFTTLPTTQAIVFAIWTTIAGLSDAVLKPLLLGRGLDVPMPVILIGVIGGMIAGGLVGLFVGPVVLGIAYVLF